MKVMRKMEAIVTENKRFRIGDTISIGETFYTTTCQKVGGKGAIFMFDQYLKRPSPMIFRHNMNNDDEKTYETSEVRKYLQSFVNMPLFDEIREVMIPFKNGDLLRIPTAEEMLGSVEAHADHEPLSYNKEQWPLMKDRRNRAAFRDNDQKTEWGWVQNRYKEAPCLFGTIDSTGTGVGHAAYVAYGMRVVFKLSI